ncbi:MAG: hypothetical protein CTY31_07180 [Hyphomicrobium sp.]|nr:MAG: hypothetical protein CTY39_02400 [Hyphomicrobium sp.]PPC99692.1 MAG: hypothetical protein CTY31_07180 [Hyphomicrobium sp.]
MCGVVNPIDETSKTLRAGKTYPNRQGWDIDRARGDGSNMVAISVRCLDDIDLASLKPVSIDGKSF